MERASKSLLLILATPIVGIVLLGIYALSIDIGSGSSSTSSDFASEADPPEAAQNPTETIASLRIASSEDSSKSEDLDTQTSVPDVASERSREREVDTPRDNETEPVESNASPNSVRTPEQRFNSRFSEQEFDPEWSYAQQERIEETVTPVLDEVYGWVENLECRETLCKVAVRQSGMESPPGEFFSSVASTLSGAEYIPSGGVIILLADHSDGNPRIILGVARYEDGLR